MGQAESGQNDDENCFRACIKQNKTPSRKVQALPNFGQKKSSDVNRKEQLGVNTIQHHEQKINSPAKQTSNVNALQTSLQQRLYTEQATVKKKNLVQHSINIVTNEPKDPPLVEGAADTSIEIVLGLQSKVSSTKNTFRGSLSKVGLTKPNVLSEATTPGTYCSSHDKESGSQTRITNKTSRTSTSKKSRNILINKIQEIKQKYYERELEIEICHDEREYQAHMDQLEQIQKTFTENSGLPQQSIGQIKAIRNKIIAKLKEKRQKNQQKVYPQMPQQTDQASINVDKPITVHDQLQLYSRQGGTTNDDASIDLARTKKQKRTKNGLNFSVQQLNKQLNTSLPEGSIDEDIKFSDYSQQSLHEIRELDEQYQDFRSKMTGPSIKCMNQIKSTKPSINNALSNILKQPMAASCPQTNNLNAAQQNLIQEQPITFKKSQTRALQVQNDVKFLDESSVKKSCMSKQGDKESSPPNNNKILLF